MGKNIKCNSSFSCSSSSSSSIGCCNKLQKCKCTPIYYPNNPYPCNTVQKYFPPCPPCPPYPPFPPFPPCPPLSQNCLNYTSAVINVTSTPITLTNTTPNINIFLTNSSSGIIFLPAISSLNNCNYNKMFILSNTGSNSNTLTLNSASSADIFTNSTISPFTSIIIDSYSSITLYSVYTGGTNYWVVQF